MFGRWLCVLESDGVLCCFEGVNMDYKIGLIYLLDRCNIFKKLLVRN